MLFQPNKRHRNVMKSFRLSLACVVVTL